MPPFGGAFQSLGIVQAGVCTEKLNPSVVMVKST
jgi:hypothetical protein